MSVKYKVKKNKNTKRDAIRRRKFKKKFSFTTLLEYPEKVNKLNKIKLLIISFFRKNK